jgi:hypothetical protein
MQPIHLATYRKSLESKIEVAERLNELLIQTPEILTHVLLLENWLKEVRRAYTGSDATLRTNFCRTVELATDSGMYNRLETLREVMQAASAALEQPE